MTRGGGKFQHSAVARHIDGALVRGEIDNSVEGKTTGWIWLLGQPEPVTLDLVGDCWRDLAGARLKFRNPSPVEVKGAKLAGQQRGVIGDMTASRKHKVPSCTAEGITALHANGEPIPMVWRNRLYLEWFSEEDGRVVIESDEFELQLSEPAWVMDGDAEEAQKLANLQAMRDFLQRKIARRPSAPDEPAPAEDDEFIWEERLKESDRLTDAYQEVMEKYMNDPDAERKEAFVMGWDGLLEAMADEAEGEPRERPEWQVEVEDSEAWKDEEEEEVFREHPLQQEAQELAMRAYDLVRDESEEDRDAGELTGSLMQVAAKLAGALNGNYEMEKGYVLAILKRCLSWQNQAISACGRLVDGEADQDHRRALESLRDEVFMLREQMTNLRRELKGD